MTENKEMTHPKLNVNISDPVVYHPSLKFLSNCLRYEMSSYDPLVMAESFWKLKERDLIRSNLCWNFAVNWLTSAGFEIASLCDLSCHDHGIFCSHKPGQPDAPITMKQSRCHDSEHQFYFVEFDNSTGKAILPEQLQSQLLECQLNIKELLNIVFNYTYDFQWYEMYLKWMGEFNPDP